MTAVPELALACAELAGVLDLLDIRTSANSVEESDGGGSLCDGGTGESGGGNDERDLGNVGDAVTAGEEESGA